MNYLLLILLCAVALPSTALAGGFANLVDARNLADQAVALFRQEKIVEGYDTLKPYWPLPGVEIDNLANQTNTQWPMVKQRFGTSIGTEFVSESRAGESLARFVFLQKFQHHALRWVFTFYKPQDQWIINAVSFDDHLANLFESQ